MLNYRTMKGEWPATVGDLVGIDTEYQSWVKKNARRVDPKPLLPTGTTSRIVRLLDDDANQLRCNGNNAKQGT